MGLYPREKAMILHKLFGKHQVDFKASHWDKGRFVSRCIICGSEMVKPTGLPWQLSAPPG